MDVGFNESDKILERLERKLHTEYAKASREMAQKANDYFEKFATEDEQMRGKYKDGKISKREYVEWRERKMLRGKYWTGMKERLANDMVNTDKLAMAYVHTNALDTYALNMNFGTYSIEKESRLDTAFTVYNRDAVLNITKNNPNLLPKNTNPQVDIPKDKRWNKQHINSAITQGILQGESVDKVAKRLRKVTDMGERSAVKNARTAMTSAQNAGRLDSMRRAKERGIGVKKAWMATLDSRTRDSHKALDGEVRNLDEEFSNGLMHPGDPNGDPSEVYNCRCRLVHEYDRYSTDWTDMRNRYDKRLGGMSYDEWKSQRTQKTAANEKLKEEQPKTNEPIIHTEAYRTLIDKIAKDYNIEYREVEDLQKPLTEEQIIEKIGGGDLTKGSCSSLSYCYIGNKCGYDVTDFRGGDSQEFFSMRMNEKLIKSLDGIEKQTFIVNKEASDVAKKLKELDLPYGKEYRLMCGRHAAIIRNTENGYEYLELQSPTRNGWKSFTEKERLKVKGITDGKVEYETIKEKCSMADTLKNRFGCRVSKSNSPIWDEASGGALRDENGLLVFGSEMELTAVDSYKGNQEFKDILCYINTALDKQQKGSKGYAK